MSTNLSGLLFFKFSWKIHVFLFIIFLKKNWIFKQDKWIRCHCEKLTRREQTKGRKVLHLRLWVKQPFSGQTGVRSRYISHQRRVWTAKWLLFNLSLRQIETFMHWPKCSMLSNSDAPWSAWLHVTHSCYSACAIKFGKTGRSGLA